MFQGYNSLFAGVLLSQEILVRHLEEQGILEKGSYRAALEEHLANVPPAGRGDIMYGPLELLIKSLGSRRVPATSPAHRADADRPAPSE
jgi:hypothetical protein